MIQRPIEAVGPAGIALLESDRAPVIGDGAARAFRSQAPSVVGGGKGLFGRARTVADVLEAYLPRDPDERSAVLVAASGPARLADGYGPMANYRFLVLTRAAVARVDDNGPEIALDTLGELTKRFTAEFDIRVVLDGHFRAVYDRLRLWLRHPNHHVRRLVSEGARPRLPWAAHLRRFREDPSGLLPLLDTLKSDRSQYVRLSVANCAADILKDHPDIGFRMLEGWLRSPDDRVRWVVAHATRYPASQGDETALRLQAAASGQ